MSHSLFRGLAYLHETVDLGSDRVKYPIAHRDIKSKNIMLGQLRIVKSPDVYYDVIHLYFEFLDENLNAKIADFNLAQVIETSHLKDNPQRRVSQLLFSFYPPD